jgi:hypothetical protein
VRFSLMVLPFLAVLSLMLMLMLLSLGSQNMARLGFPTPWSISILVLTYVFAILSVAGLVQGLRSLAWPEVSFGLRLYSLLVSLANVTVFAYLAYWGWIGVRTWA